MPFSTVCNNPSFDYIFEIVFVKNKSKWRAVFHEDFMILSGKVENDLNAYRSEKKFWMEARDVLNII